MTLTNLSAALSGDFIGSFLAGPFTIGVSTNPGQIDMVLILCLCRVGLHESKIIRIAILELVYPPWNGNGT